MWEGNYFHFGPIFKKMCKIKVHIYFEKATKFCEFSTVYLSYVVPVKSTVEILQNFAAISKYMYFKDEFLLLGCVLILKL